MAYGSASRGGGRRSDSRGAGGASRGRPPARRSGGSGPVIGAVVIVVAVIGVIVALTTMQKRDEPKAPPRQPARPTPARPDTPAAPRELPPPELSAAQRRAVEQLGVIASIRSISEEGEQLYAEAGKAKRDNDQDRWQQMLEEAAIVFRGINDVWAEIIGHMPSNADWDEERVANHYFPAEADAYQRAMRRMGEIQKDRR